MQSLIFIEAGMCVVGPYPAQRGHVSCQSSVIEFEAQFEYRGGDVYRSCVNCWAEFRVCSLLIPVKSQ